MTKLKIDKFNRLLKDFISLVFMWNQFYDLFDNESITVYWVRGFFVKLIDCLSYITKSWTHSSPFNDCRNYVKVFLISDSVNLVMALSGSVSDVRSFEAKNRVLSSILLIKIQVQVRSIFEFIRIKLKWCSNPLLNLGYRYSKEFTLHHY